MTDFKTETLKQCPFCGGDGEVFSTGDEPRNIAYVECRLCNIKGEEFEQLRNWEVGTHIECAIRAWNTRAPLPHYEDLLNKLRRSNAALIDIREGRTIKTKILERVILQNEQALAKLEGGES